MVLDRRLGDEPVERAPVEPVGEGLLGREPAAAFASESLRIWFWNSRWNSFDGDVGRCRRARSSRAR